MKGIPRDPDPARYWSNLVDDGTGALSPRDRQFEPVPDPSPLDWPPQHPTPPPLWQDPGEVHLNPPHIIARNFLILFGVPSLLLLAGWWFGW